jgi:hypothetical protein
VYALGPAVHVAPGAEDHDRRMRARQRVVALGKRRAVHDWHLNVKQNGVGRVLLYSLQRLGAVRRAYDLITLVEKRKGDHISNFSVIIDDEDAQRRRFQAALTVMSQSNLFAEALTAH